MIFHALEFIAHHSVVPLIYRCLFVSGCGGTFNDDTGLIFSPGYPTNYQHNLTCDYVILASPNQFIVLQIDDSNFRIKCKLPRL